MPMPSTRPESQAASRGEVRAPRAAEELARVLLAQGGLVWLSGRSILFLILLLGWLAVR
jgi:hypothetical protein